MMYMNSVHTQLHKEVKGERETEADERLLLTNISLISSPNEKY